MYSLVVVGRLLFTLIPLHQKDNQISLYMQIHKQKMNLTIGLEFLERCLKILSGLPDHRRRSHQVFNLRGKVTRNFFLSSVQTLEMYCLVVLFRTNSDHCFSYSCLSINVLQQNKNFVSHSKAGQSCGTDSSIR